MASEFSAVQVRAATILRQTSGGSRYEIPVHACTAKPAHQNVCVRTPTRMRASVAESGTFYRPRASHLENEMITRWLTVASYPNTSHGQSHIDLSLFQRDGPLDNTKPGSGRVSSVGGGGGLGEGVGGGESEGGLVCEEEGEDCFVWIDAAEDAPILHRHLTADNFR